MRENTAAVERIYVVFFVFPHNWGSKPINEHFVLATHNTTLLLIPITLPNAFDGKINTKDETNSESCRTPHFFPIFISFISMTHPLHYN